MKKILIIVDMQNDFIDGSLGTGEAVSIVPKVAEYIRSFDGKVFFTRDTHTADYLQTAEGKKLPVEHCIQNTEGWKLHPQMEALQKELDAPVFDKLTFGSVELARYISAEQASFGGIESITLCGLCTDICVISNALLFKAFLPEIPIRIVEECCAGVTPESHENALNAMKMCQIEVV